MHCVPASGGLCTFTCISWWHGGMWRFAHFCFLLFGIFATLALLLRLCLHALHALRARAHLRIFACGRYLCHAPLLRLRRFARTRTFCALLRCAHKSAAAPFEVSLSHPSNVCVHCAQQLA